MSEPVAVTSSQAIARLKNGRAGGVYMPPFKLARLMSEVTNKSSVEYQRLTWEALKKSINGIINKVNASNIKNILVEIFKENLIRGRGLFCRSLMKSQMASPNFSAVYAALAAVVNTKFPEIGELLLSRLLIQFKRSFKRNDKPVCSAAVKFLAHLVNQGVAHEVLALEILILLLEEPSEDSVELAVDFVKEVGAYLQDVAPQGLYGVFERFRAVLHEGSISKRVQFIVEGMFALRKAGFEASGFPSIRPELDLVESTDQITHELGLEDEVQPQTMLDLFKEDPEYEQSEKRYAAILREILGEESDEEEGDEEADGDNKRGGSQSDADDDEDEEDDGEDSVAAATAAAEQQKIQDRTATNLVNLRRTIYLTLMSSLDFEEAGHKLLKIQIQPGQEIEIVNMIVECCSQERTYKRFFGLLAQRFCFVNRTYQDLFSECFAHQYSEIHRLETSKLRNVACLFAALLAADALSWQVLETIELTEASTTSASRIFVKYLFQELSSSMGLVQLNLRLNDPDCKEWYKGIFPETSLADMRFAINFFTSIGLGGVTDSMRTQYKMTVAEKAAEAQRRQEEEERRRAAESSEGSSSDDDATNSDSSSSGSSSSGSSSSGSSSSGSSSSGSSSSDSDSSDSRRGGLKNTRRKRNRSRNRSSSGDSSDRDRRRDRRRRRSP